MEEILSSIRRIIADEDGGKATKPQAARPGAPAAAKGQAPRPAAAKTSPDTAAPATPAPTGAEHAPPPQARPAPIPRPSQTLAPAARQTQAATDKALDEIGAMVASGLTRIVAQQEAAAKPATAAEQAEPAAPAGTEAGAAAEDAPAAAAPLDLTQTVTPQAAGPAPAEVAQPKADTGTKAQPGTGAQADATAEAEEVVFRDAGADVLELTQVVLPDGTVADTRAGRAREGLPAAVAEAAAAPRAKVTLASAEPDPDGIAAPRSEQPLYRERAPRPDTDEEAMAADALERAMLRLLKPMLRQWMDENLEGIVERIVREELRRRP